MIRVLLAHHHALTREGLRRVLAEATGIDVAAVAADTNEALRAARRHHPDVIVADLDTPDLEDLSTARRRGAAGQHTPIVVLVAQPESVDAGRLARSGALGYVAAQSAPGDLIEAVRSVHEGRRYVCPQLQRVFEQEPTVDHEAENPLAHLTTRERQAFRLLAAGRTLRETAAALGLSRKTVSTHRAAILNKLELRNNAELARFAVQHKLLND